MIPRVEPRAMENYAWAGVIKKQAAAEFQNFCG